MIVVTRRGAGLKDKYQAEHERVRKWLEEQGML
jgi:hypothetical protein